MKRRVEPEMLDELPVTDPMATRSRRDLERVNAWMSSARIMARGLEMATRERLPRRLIDLGAGDGTFLLQVARQLPARWKGTNAVLVDRQITFGAETRAAFAALGWGIEVLAMDVFDWLNYTTPEPGEGFTANLFLHHIPQSLLARLLAGVEKRAQCFVAVEPRRSRWSLAFSRGLWLIGCGPVTRHDAPVSVRAGFAGCELSCLWPSQGNWALEERSAGWFSHLFVARSKQLMHASG